MSFERFKAKLKTMNAEELQGILQALNKNLQENKIDQFKAKGEKGKFSTASIRKLKRQRAIVLTYLNQKVGK